MSKKNLPIHVKPMKLSMHTNGQNLLTKCRKYKDEVDECKIPNTLDVVLVLKS